MEEELEMVAQPPPSARKRGRAGAAAAPAPAASRGRRAGAPSQQTGGTSVVVSGKRLLLLTG